MPQMALGVSYFYLNCQTETANIFTINVLMYQGSLLKFILIFACKIYFIYLCEPAGLVTHKSKVDVWFTWV